jgi:hypothetical protein
MQIILREEEIKQAVLNYLGLSTGVITEMKIRRKTAGKADVGSVSITLKTEKAKRKIFARKS